MSRQLSIEQLLRWRLALAETEAPPAPRAARLLEAVRPWWELWPERFRAQAARLGRMQTAAFGYAMADPRLARTGHPVPALVVHSEELETFVRVLYFSVRGDRLRLRFHLDGVSARAEPGYEVTFVSDGGADGGADARPLLAAAAEHSTDGEYRLDAALPDEIASRWERLKVTDPMPFRLILRPTAAGAG